MIKKEAAYHTSVSIIGAGNVAWCLAHEFHQKDIKIKEVFSRSLKNAQQICNAFGGQSITNLTKLNQSSDLYIIAVPDKAISEVAKKIHIPKGAIVVHTSGSESIDVLANHHKHGSFYPLQTFTKGKDVSFTNIQICVEGSSKEVEIDILNFAHALSNHVVKLNSTQRRNLHLAAVFANNFTNYMLTLASDICTEHEVDFNLLKPLIKETFNKLNYNKPHNNQTGPAVRNDKNTINNHLLLLSNNPVAKDVYQTLTTQILKRYHDKEEL